MNLRLPLTSLLALAGTLAAQSPFTTGNLVILRVGDGTTALSSNAAAMFLDEYTTAGVLVQSVALPTAASGSNRAIAVRGTATSEAYLNVSSNGRYLICCGYDAVPGTPDTGTAGSGAAAVNRVIARVDLLGAVDTSTALTDAYSGLTSGTPPAVSTQGNPRAVISDDGQRFWTSGTGGPADSGIHFVSGLGASTSTTVSNAPSNCRVAGIYDSQLYTTSASTVFLGVCQVGTGLPVVPASTNLLPGFPTTGSTAAESAYDFFFADRNTLYVADDNSIGSTRGGIQKWTFNGITWTMQYRLLLNGVDTGCRGLTGFVQNGNVTLWGTANTNATGGAQTVLVTVTDTGPASVVTAVATSPSNTAFRGLRFLAKPTTMQRFPHSCGTADIKVNGNGQIGTPVRTTILNAVGVPFVSYGLTANNIVFCGCTVAHDNLLTVLGPVHTLSIPNNPAFIGLRIYLQGADLGAPGGCSPTIPFTLTDSFTFTVQ